MSALSAKYDATGPVETDGTKGPFHLKKISDCSKNLRRISEVWWLKVLVSLKTRSLEPPGCDVCMLCRAFAH